MKKSTLQTPSNRKSISNISPNPKENLLNLSAEKLKKQLEIIKASKQGKGDKQVGSDVSPGAVSTESLNGKPLDSEEASEEKGLFAKLVKTRSISPEKSKSVIIANNESLKISNFPAESLPDLHSSCEVLDNQVKVMKYQKVINEIYETEFSYSNDLDSIVTGYMKDMENDDWRETSKLLFGNIDEICIFSRKLSNDFKLSEGNTTKIGDLFSEKKNQFITLYGDYCTNYVLAIEKLENLLRDPTTASFFSNIQSRLQHMLPISSYLLKPVQRILKYHLLLNSLADALEKAEIPDDSVRKASEVMSCVADEINKLKREKEDSARFEVFRSTIKNLENFELQNTGPILIEEMANVNKATRLILIFKRYVLINYVLNGNIQCTNVLPIRQIDISFDSKRSKLTLQLDNEPFSIRGKTDKSTKAMCDKLKKLKNDILEQLKSKDPKISDEFLLPCVQICEVSLGSSISGNTQVSIDRESSKKGSSFSLEDSSDSATKYSTDDSISLWSPEFSPTTKSTSNNQQQRLSKQIFANMRNSVSNLSKRESVNEKNSQISRSKFYSSLKKIRKKSVGISVSNPLINKDFSESIDCVQIEMSSYFNISEKFSNAFPSYQNSITEGDCSLSNDEDPETLSETLSETFSPLSISEDVVQLNSSKLTSHRRMPTPHLPVKRYPNKNQADGSALSSVSEQLRRPHLPSIPLKKNQKSYLTNTTSMYIPKPPPKNVKKSRMSDLVMSSNIIHETSDSHNPNTLSKPSSKSEEILKIQNNTKPVKKPVPAVPQKKS